MCFRWWQCWSPDTAGGEADWGDVDGNGADNDSGNDGGGDGDGGGGTGGDGGNGGGDADRLIVVTQEANSTREWGEAQPIFTKALSDKISTEPIEH